MEQSLDRPEERHEKKPGEGRIYDAGVDYITATHVGRASESSLIALGHALVLAEQKSGEEWRSFHFSGYKGESCGSASFGLRHDSQIVRLSSRLAKAHWRAAYELSSNVTRLDVQMTVLLEVGPSRALALHHRQLRRRNRGRGRPAKFKAWYGPYGCEAMTLGSRTSDWFGRCYDKGLESRLPEYAGTVRYEAELKRLVAVSHAKALYDASSEHNLAILMVHAFLNRRSLRIPGFARILAETPGCSSSSDKANVKPQLSIMSRLPAMSESELSIGQGAARRRAAWLANSVKPSVQEFLARGQANVVLEALGLQVLNGTISSTENELWSKFQKWRR